MDKDRVHITKTAKESDLISSSKRKPIYSVDVEKKTIISEEFKTQTAEFLKKVSTRINPYNVFVYFQYNYNLEGLVYHPVVIEFMKE